MNELQVSGFKFCSVGGINPDVFFDSLYDLYTEERIFPDINSILQGFELSFEEFVSADLYGDWYAYERLMTDEAREAFYQECDKYGAAFVKDAVKLLEFHNMFFIDLTINKEYNRPFGLVW